MPKKIFLLFDGRAKCGDCEDANCMDTAETEEEARQSGEEDWADYDAIWYECNVVEDVIDGGFPRWDLPPAGGME